MRFIDELCVRRAVQRASGHGFLVGSFTTLSGVALSSFIHPLLGLVAMVSILTPIIFNKNTYLGWEVKRAEEDVRCS